MMNMMKHQAMVRIPLVFPLLQQAIGTEILRMNGIHVLAIMLRFGVLHCQKVNIEATGTCVIADPVSIEEPSLRMGLSLILSAAYMISLIIKRYIWVNIVE